MFYVLIYKYNIFFEKNNFFVKNKSKVDNSVFFRQVQFAQSL